MIFGENSKWSQSSCSVHHGKKDGTFGYQCSGVLQKDLFKGR